MLGNLIVAASLMGQAPPPRPAPAAPARKPAVSAKDERAQLVAKRRARAAGHARWEARVTRERAEAERKAAVAAEEQYRRDLPAMLEIRRQDLAAAAAAEQAAAIREAARSQAASAARDRDYAWWLQWNQAAQTRALLLQGRR